MKTKTTKFEIFCENHPPTRHIKNKKIDFAPCIKSIMAKNFLSTNLKRFLGLIKSPWRVHTYRALIVPNWPKWQSLNPHNFTKNDHRWNIFSN